MAIIQSRQKTKRVLLVDDHPVMRRGLKQVINAEEDLEVCGEAGDLIEAVQQVASLTPDLVVIDISLGDGGNGIELIKEIKAQFPEMGMLVASMHDESLFAERVLRAGARGYISKDEPAEALIKALRNVLAGQIALSPGMTERLLFQMATNGKEPSRSPIEKLSDRELEVFEMIGHGLSTKQIAAKLELSPKTIETYREHIKTKLNLDHGSELSRHAVQWVLQGH